MTKKDMPVYTLDWSHTTYANGALGIMGTSTTKLPTLRLSKARMNEAGEPDGRIPWCVYPQADDPDEDGWLALDLGAKLYTEAFSYDDARYHDLSVECFKAAELLYLHALARGNDIAQLNLGYVYSYNRCEGQYFLADQGAQSAQTDAYPHEARAFECFMGAANAGVAEASYKLGDLYRSGKGCYVDVREALFWYQWGYDHADRHDCVTWGSSAFRLARAYEQGEGTKKDYTAALRWYREAEAGLSLAVDEGNWFYEGTLSAARSGIKRMQQETS